MSDIKTNHSESKSFKIQEILQEELHVLRELLNLFSIEEHCLESPEVQEKKTLLKQRSEIFKKLRLLKKEKELIYENFFFEQAEDCELSILKDHLDSIRTAVDKKQITLRKTLKSDLLFTQKLEAKSEKKLKTTLKTLDIQEESAPSF